MDLPSKVFGYVIGQACWAVLTKLFVFADEHEYDWWVQQHQEKIPNGGITLSNYDKERQAFYDDGRGIHYLDQGLVLKRFRMSLLGEWTTTETLSSVFTNCWNSGN